VRLGDEFRADARPLERARVHGGGGDTGQCLGDGVGLQAAVRRQRDVPGAGVYTSPLERARVCAELIAKPHRLEPRVEPDFREMGFGAWEGLRRDELAQRFPREAQAWGLTPHLVTPPDGETLGATAARVRAALARLIAAHAGETAIVVTHAIVLRLIVLAALGLGPERLWSVDASPAGITEIEYAGDWATVHRMNTLAHLEARPEAGA